MSPKKKKIIKNEQVKNDGWTNVLTGLGYSNRDKKQAGVFRNCIEFSQVELDQLYRSDGLSRIIIDSVADEMIRQGWEVEGDTDCNINSKLEVLDAQSQLSLLIKWARLYGGALIVMGIEDGRSLEEPVNYRNISDIKWLRTFDRFQATSANGTFDSNLNSPNYGFPEMYLVTDSRTGLTFYVHHSRVLRMDWNILPPREQNFNDGWGDSVINCIYEELRNYQTLYGNIATMSQDFVTKVLKINGLSDLIATCEAEIVKRVNLLNLTSGVTNTSVIDSTESLDKHTTQTTGIPEIMDRFMLSLSAVSGVPVSLLFGRSPSGLNATGENDVRNFYDKIKQYQESKLRKVLEKLIDYIFISKNISSKMVVPENWHIEFVPLWQNTEEQEAMIRRTVAETDAIYLDRGVLDANEVAVSRFGGGRWSMNTEIDIEARDQGYNKEETEQLELQKEKNSNPSPTIGPDFIPSNISSPLITNL